MKWCTDERVIKNLESLQQTVRNSSDYTAICKQGYELESREKAYTCFNQEGWLQPLRCSKISNDTTVTATDNLQSDSGMCTSDVSFRYVAV